ncbi:hypothetical protein [Thioalkalivibrio sp. XN279]|uniref:hypothetical protein n=1 Tax=Thioalkalivibrio sp. XN279 TaxID=2714953 RepID=UPI001F0CEC69|nr:hypothetical protein [Thioalkalivibrio sp. XN279]
MLVAADLWDEFLPDPDDTRNRFAALLRREGYQEKQIEAALASVSPQTMSRVLSGEERIQKYPVSALTNPEAKLDLSQEAVVIPDFSYTFGAGLRAQILVSGELTDEQQRVLETVAKLIHQILPRPSSTTRKKEAP